MNKPKLSLKKTQVAGYTKQGLYANKMYLQIKNNFTNYWVSM